MTGSNQAFWQQKSLADMDELEWESLCDGCGRCCLVKLENEDSGEIYFTNIACRLFDDQTCRCKNYSQRHQEVTDCLSIRPMQGLLQGALPTSCAYRRLAEGRELADWHPLVSGEPDSVHASGISMRGWVIPEAAVASDELEDYIIQFDSD